VRAWRRGSGACEDMLNEEAAERCAGRSACRRKETTGKVMRAAQVVCVGHRRSGGGVALQEGAPVLLLARPRFCGKGAAAWGEGGGEDL